MHASINSRGLRSLGLSYIWSNQVHKRIVRQRLRDQNMQEWQSRVVENCVCCKYRLLRRKLCFQEYLIYIPSTLRQRVLKFRLSSHRHTCPANMIVRYPEGRKNNYILFVTVVRQEIHFIIFLTVSMDMLKESVLSVQIDITHIIPTCPNCVAL